MRIAKVQYAQRSARSAQFFDRNDGAEIRPRVQYAHVLFFLERTQFEQAVFPGKTGSSHVLYRLGSD